LAQGQELTGRKKGRKKNILTRKGKKERKTYLTHTGPLMEGVRPPLQSY
jgi:hypothetical protein